MTIKCGGVVEGEGAWWLRQAGCNALAGVWWLLMTISVVEGGGGVVADASSVYGKDHASGVWWCVRTIKYGGMERGKGACWLGQVWFVERTVHHGTTWLACQRNVLSVHSNWQW